MKTVRERVKKIIFDIICADINDDSSISHFDSIDFMEIVMDIEDEFCIELPYQIARNCKTVSDLVSLTERLLK